MSDLACKPFLNWVGGKGDLRDIICPVFPPGIQRYVEHFGGGGGILLGTPKRPGVLEVYNDFDSDLVNLFLCVRDRPMALMRELGCLPLQMEEEFILLKRFLAGEEVMPDFTRDELKTARTCLSPEQFAALEPVLRGRAALWDVRRAAAFYRVNRYSFSGTMKSFGVKSNPLRHFLPAILAAAQRLEGVVITNRDFKESFRLNDREGVLHYFDPPYVETEDKYRPVFTREDHHRLHSLTRHAKGFMVFSYNDCPFIRDLFRDCFILGFARQNSLSQKKGAVFREVIITNYDPRPVIEANAPQLDLFGGGAQRREPVLLHQP